MEKAFSSSNMLNISAESVTVTFSPRRNEIFFLHRLFAKLKKNNLGVCVWGNLLIPL